MDQSKELQRLIVGCLDDERALRYESGLVEGDSRVMLRRLADDRERFADRLRTFGEPGDHASVSTRNRIRELARSLRVLAGGRHHGDSIAACKRSCDRIEALYTEVMQRQWSQAILPTLTEHRSQIRQARGELRAIQY